MVADRKRRLKPGSVAELTSPSHAYTDRVAADQLDLWDIDEISYF